MKATDLNLYSLFEHMEGRTVHTATIDRPSANGIRRCIKAGLVRVVDGNLVLTAEGVTAQRVYETKYAAERLASARAEFERASVIADMTETRNDVADFPRARATVAKYAAAVEAAEARVARLTK
jgi:hypothetical protein